jgi:hypothetical protein
VLQARPRPAVPVADTSLPDGRPYVRFELLRVPSYCPEPSWVAYPLLFKRVGRSSLFFADEFNSNASFAVILLRDSSRTNCSMPNPQDAHQLRSDRTGRTGNRRGFSQFLASALFCSASSKQPCDSVRGDIAFLDKQERRPAPRRTPFLKNRSRKTLTVPMAAETPVLLDAAADIPVADHGLARASAHSNGWHDRYARAVRCHSSARAAAAVPGYR